MTITHTSFWIEDLPLSRPYTIAYKTTSAVQNYIIKLTLSDGQTAWGAGSPGEHVTGEKIEAGKLTLQNAVDQLPGTPVQDVMKWLHHQESAFATCPAALAALDIALHDAYAKILGVPLAQLWGQVLQPMPTSITIGIKSPEDSLLEAQEYLGRGFRVLKVKTGHSLEQDLAVLSLLRERLPSDILIRIDANRGYNLATLKKFLAAAEKLTLEFIEQPLPIGSWPDLLNLPWSQRQTLCADEELQSPADGITLTPADLPYGIFNIKLMKCGGLRRGRQIAHIAQAAQLDLMWGCMDESIISITAALHLALACPATRYLDLDGSLDLAHDVVKGGFELRDGVLWPLDEVGLGVG